MRPQAETGIGVLLKKGTHTSITTPIWTVTSLHEKRRGSEVAEVLAIVR